MATKLLNPWALDSEGKLVNAENAVKGQQYSCPVCKEQLSLCKKGNGPNARRDHFKHRPDSHCPGPSESDIHKLAKEGIYNILHCAIEKHQALPIAWTCPDCGMDFRVNLLKKAKSVEKEKDLGTSRPDIALLDENGNVIVAVEIVFTHEPTTETIKFYNEKNIVLIRYVFHTIEECNFLFAKLSYPDSVNMCFRHSCPSCQSMPFPRKLVPLRNDEGKYTGLAVGIETPFNDEPFLGLSFSEQDKIEAQTFVNERSSTIQINYIEKSGMHWAAFVRKQVVAPHPTRYSRYGGSPIDYIDIRMGRPKSKSSNRSNYGKPKSSTSKKNPGAKKTGGKRRR